MPAFIFRVSFLCSESVHADGLALFGRLFEPNLSVNQGKQCVVPSYSYGAARLDHGAALAHEDRPGADDGPVPSFNPQSLALAVATVARATNAFLVCHSF